MSTSDALVDIIRKFIIAEDEMHQYDYNAQFLRIRLEQDTMRTKAEYSCKIAANPKYFSKNRYRDIIPYDKNRVKLSWRKSSEVNESEDDEGYINASYVAVPPADAKYIAAQAPLSTTLNDWFKMIYENDVAVIVMLCKLVELGKAKCERYWPEEVGNECTFGGVVVRLEEEKHYDEFCSRRLRIKWSDGEQRIVQQLHYSEWPDHGCPTSEDHVLEMIELFDKMHYQQPEKPVLVHCSAGCGRTGTIIAANTIRELINTQTIAKELNLYDLVIELRTQRVSMVQTPDQYEFLHKLVLHFCCQKLLVLGEELPKRKGSASAECPPDSSAAQADDVPSKPERISESRTEVNCTEIVTIPDYPEEPTLKPLGPEPMPLSWNEGNTVTG